MITERENALIHMYLFLFKFHTTKCLKYDFHDWEQDD